MKQITSLFLLVVVEFVIPGFGQDFGYDGTEGPNYWGEKYRHCVGKHQSPINIEEHDVEVTSLLPMVYENFDKTVNLSIINNGHTVQFRLNSDEELAVTGGPLIGKYVFAQMHFHWGDNDQEGSENRINNNSFPMELHMVFYSASYGSVQAATEHPDGLCVLSFLYSKQDELNDNYTAIISTLPNVKEVGSTADVPELLTIENILAKDKSTYFFYGGSLTTPPCSEVVTWIEYKHTISLAHEQMEVFRHLKSNHGELMHNFRSPQPLHGRVIRMNKDVNYRSTANQSLCCCLVPVILSFLSMTPIIQLFLLKISS